jgi:hypothetical protein
VRTEAIQRGRSNRGERLGQAATGPARSAPALSAQSNAALIAIAGRQPWPAVAAR